MFRYCLKSVIWLTSGMICVQAAIPGYLFGCQCSSSIHSKCEQSIHHCSCCKESSSSKSHQSCCCSNHKKTDSTPGSNNSGQQFSLNSDFCGCGQVKHSPTIPAESEMIQIQSISSMLIVFDTTFLEKEKSTLDPEFIDNPGQFSISGSTGTHTLLCVWLT